MCKCWEAINGNIKIQLGNIISLFQKSFYEIKHAHTSPFYGNFRGSISRVALRRIGEEWLRVDIVGINTQIWECTHRKVYGSPRAYDLWRKLIEDIHIH